MRIIISIIVTLTMALSFAPIVHADAAAIKTIKMLIQLDGNEAKTFESIRKSALESIPYSQYLLGIMYVYGIGTSVNNDEGVNWLKKAALNGDVDAQRDLGAIYLLGKLVPSNYIESAKWFTLAAEQLDPKSMDVLGMLYKSGRGVKKDLVKAYAFYNLAVSLGNNDAIEHRSEISTLLTSNQTIKAQKISENLRSKYTAKLKHKADSKYSKEPIEVNSNKLPNDYHGNNFNKICNVLFDKKQSLIKGTLESEVMYSNRINKMSKKSIVDNLKIGSLIAIKDELMEPLDKNYKYNESTNTIDISLGTANSKGLQTPGPEIDIKGNYSKITTSMQIQFSKTTMSGYQNSILYINKNQNDTELVDYPGIKNVPTRKIRVKVNQGIIEQLANNKYGLLYISIITPPFSFIHKNNNQDDNLKDTTTDYYLVLDVIQFWIYNLKTGEIIAKIDN